ncbi:MAG: SpoIIE family protein phosphatase [Amphritea sp.]
MGLNTQHILLLDDNTEQIDLIFSQLEAADLNDVRIISAFSCDQARQLMENYHFALIIMNADMCTGSDYLGQLVDRQFPHFIIAITKSEKFRELLRSGMSDVYAIVELQQRNRSFGGAVKCFLQRARLMEQSVRYRESLETSLDELRADQEAARQVQQNMLPAQDINFCGVHFQYSITPSLYLSGDFVDIAPLDEQRCLFYLADVSGHGASSALVTVLLKNIMNRQLKNYRLGNSDNVLSPLKMLECLNKELLDAQLGKHLTIFMAVLDCQSQALTYAIGGHHPMPVLKQDGCSSFLAGRGMPIGLFEQPVFEEHSIRLSGSYELTLFSDGILEILQEDSQKEKESGLLELLLENSFTANQIKSRLIDKTSFRKGAIPDDVAIMTIHKPEL